MRQRFVSATACFLMVILFTASSVLSIDYPMGDNGKPQDYELTIKRFRDELPQSEAYIKALPSSFDWRTKGWVTAAKDQGSCGSCWAFAAVGVLESRILMSKYAIPKVFNLSEQQQISCNDVMHGCSGGSMSALKFWENKGPSKEISRGYPSKDGSEYPCSNFDRVNTLVWHTRDYYTVDTNITDMKTSIYQDGPAYFRFDVYSDFQDFWRAGKQGQVYLQSSGIIRGGHAVLIIGWDDTRQAWLCRNSWGSTQGPNGDGTFWIGYAGHAHDLNFGMASMRLGGWARLSSPNSNEYPKDMAVDRKGNVFLTGQYHGGASGHEYGMSTFSYDPDGNLRWKRRYDGPLANSDDYGTAIAVDGSGNVYVAGGSKGSLQDLDYDFTTIKYDANGNRKWVRRYTASSGSRDSAEAIAVDSSGNVYVTGESDGATATIKYDTDGKRKWLRRWRTRVHEDGCRRIAVDAVGNAYVLAGVKGAESGYDFALAKYDPNGNRKWIKHYNGPANQDDIAKALAVDGSGNLYVTGLAKGTASGFVTLKYDSAGNLKWHRWSNGAHGESIALDSSGNAYVAGLAMCNSSYCYLTVKFDADGNRQWAKRHHSGPTRDDYPLAIGVDGTGNIYVTGNSRDRQSNSSGILTVKYAANGERAWISRYRWSKDSDEAPCGLAIDETGHVYIAAQNSAGQSPDQSRQHLILKYHNGTAP